MDFGTATGYVLTELRRPDLTSMVQRKINATVQLINGMGRFPKDLYEASYTTELMVGSYTQSLALPANTRVVAYLQDPARILESDPVIKIVDYMTVINNPTKADIAYQAGSVLQVRLSVIPTSLLLGVYTSLPPLSLPTDTNWILEEFGEVVVEYAAAAVWRYIGEREAATRLEQFTATALRVLVADRINQLYGVL